MPGNFKPAAVLMGQARAKSMFRLAGNVRGNKKGGRYDVQFPANEAPTASFVKALFTEAVKVKIARRTKYYVHY
ncbi:hypothetical protein ACFLYX_00175 [Chloroflexota bacterium]